MSKSDTQILGSTENLPQIKIRKRSEVNFSMREEIQETSIIGKIAEKLDVKERFVRLKKRLRTRSTNIL